MPDNLGQAVNVRVVGVWRWKTVIVPPNAYVVHTRQGSLEPLHLGLGLSIRFNPYTDAFLVVPSTMQTILINAYCICRELQGLLVQGYVQWIIADFATAYRKLDFTDVADPMRVVNVQLREQAEAAIKDKVATMSIDAVLSDKQPIIEELTTRLRHVAEGEGDSDKGLGLRIVTVQIKEAVVSSTRLWENLQKPFRTERAQVARLAELAAESVVQAQELEHERLRHQQGQEVARQAMLERNETAKQEQQAKRELEEAATAHALALTQARLEARHQEALKEIELRMAQLAREVEVVQASANLDTIRLEKESELARFRLQEELARNEIQVNRELALKEATHAVTNRQTEAEVEFEAARQRIHNDISASHVQARLIEALPAVVEHLPKPDELRSISIGAGTGLQDGQPLVSLITQILAVLDAFRSGVSGKQ